MKNRLDSVEGQLNGIGLNSHESAQLIYNANSEMKSQRKLNRKNRKSQGKKGSSDFCPGSHARKIISTYSRIQNVNFGSVVGKHIPLITDFKNNCQCDQESKKSDDFSYHDGPTTAKHSTKELAVSDISHQNQKLTQNEESLMKQYQSIITPFPDRY